MESEPFKVQQEIVDNDIVSFFDLLAKFDFEDQQKAGSVSASDPSVQTPSEGSLIRTENNPDSNPAVSAIRSNNLALKKQ